MPAYLLIRVQVHDPEALKEYQAVAPAIVEQYGGRFLTRGGEMLALEGPGESRRTILIEFDNLGQTQVFYNSPEYQAAIKLRAGAATFEITALEGVE